jgi:hypothetical protein
MLASGATASAGGSLTSSLARARRPSSLQYCLKSTAPRLAPPPATPPEDEESNQPATAAADEKTLRQPSTAVVSFAEPMAIAITAHDVVDRPSTRRSSGASAWPGAAATSARIVAPKATPEDSIIDSCSTADEDEDDGLEYRLLGSFGCAAVTSAIVSEHGTGDGSTTTVTTSTTVAAATATAAAADHLKAGAADINLLNYDRRSLTGVGSDELQRRTSSVGDEEFDEFDDDDADDDDDEYEDVRNDAELCQDELPPPSVVVRQRRHQQQQQHLPRVSRSVSPDPFRLADALEARAIVAAGGGSCDPAGFPLRLHHWTVADRSDGSDAVGSGTSLPGCLPLGVGATRRGPFREEETEVSKATTAIVTSSTLPRATVVLRPVEIVEGSSDTEATLTPAVSNHSSLSAASSSTLTLSRRHRQRRSPPNLSLVAVADRRVTDNGGSRSRNGGTCSGGSAGRSVAASAAVAGVPTIGGCGSGGGLSPGSPSYDATHARFSHLGAHALDVFYSPDGNDDDDDDDFDADADDDDLENSASAARLCPSPVLSSSLSPTVTTVSTDATATATGTFWRPVFIDHSSTPVRPSSSLSSSSTTQSKPALVDHTPQSSTAVPVAPVVDLIEGFSDIDDDHQEVQSELNAETVRSAALQSADTVRDDDDDNDDDRSTLAPSAIDSRTEPQAPVVAASAVVSNSRSSAANMTTTSTFSVLSSSNTTRNVAVVSGGPPPSARRVSTDDSPGVGCRRVSGGGGSEGGSSSIKDDGGSATWLMLPELSSSSIHRDGHSPCTSIVWPAEALRTR